MQNVLITGPSVEPVSVSDAISHLRLGGVDLPDSETTLLGSLITAARTFFENKTKLAVISQTWRLTFNQIPRDGNNEGWWDGVREGSISELSSESKRFIELPTGPLISVTSFKAYAEDDTSSTFTDYLVQTSLRPGRVALRNGSVWPIATRGVGNFEIDYVAGFGTAASEVPGDITLAIKQLVAFYYENREAMATEALSDLPMATRNIIRSRSVIRL